MLFGRSNSSPAEYIIAGLGNPGSRYSRTRHNTGFMAIDALAERYGIDILRSRFEALTGTGKIEGRNVLLMKPQTFMNESGRAVGAAMRYYKVAPENIIVLLDDINLDVGIMRIRQKGSDGGQKGMRSIIEHCGSSDIPRIKIGVGKKPSPEYDLADWVLSKFTQDELKVINDTAANAVKAAALMIEGRTEEAMNLYSR